MNKQIIWTNRYSQDDSDDKFGRWARVAYYNQITIAWIIKVVGDNGVRYVAKPFFPTIANDSPFQHCVLITEQEAKYYIEDLFNKFQKQIK